LITCTRHIHSSLESSHKCWTKWLRSRVRKAGMRGDPLPYRLELPKVDGLLCVHDASALNPKHFIAGRYYRLAEGLAVPPARGPLVLLVAEDGKPSWLMSYRLKPPEPLVTGL
jgi:hypothetical protein